MSVDQEDKELGNWARIERETRTKRSVATIFRLTTCESFRRSVSDIAFDRSTEDEHKELGMDNED
uniref:Uncharacterized protein n=1 Tax=Pristionchus pacificus TaxID=54126 RepID=A0A2A6C9H1_PRIPA|eukprot:PDM74728.1 hypothetical protein PRIPAC_43679 [Pristionchus pacificus]